MKKVKIILLSLGLFIALAYIFRGPDWPEQQATLSQLTIPSSTQVIDIDIAFAEKPWDKELQEKFLSKIKGKEKLPKFENFPATDFSSKKNFVVDVNSDPIGKIYPTAIRYGVSYSGINFNGKYSIAEWGCGTGCQDGAIVNTDTGRIYPLPGLTTNGHETRKDSRLLIYNPITLGGDWPRDPYRMIYWEWTGQSLRLLGVYRVDLAKKEVVEVKEDYAYYSSWLK